MGGICSIGFYAFGFGFKISFKRDEVTSKQKIEGFLNQTEIEIISVIR